MITLVSTPGYADPLSPSIISRWVATESPNIFRLWRQDWTVNTTANNGGFLRVTVDGAFTGNDGDAIVVYDATTESVYVGTIDDASGAPVIDTDIPFVTGMNITYLNDNTLFGGYYFEGRLTVNGILEPLTIIASPDSKGYADLDVSGILRIKTSLGKTADYTDLIAKEPTKSGRFSFEYRGCWYGSDEEWIPEGGSISPPSDEILWYYAECVRSEEQGSNLHDYVMSDIHDAPFLNMFEQPVYFAGLPFDISFILPELAEVNPASDITVTQKIYNSVNTQLGLDIVNTIPADQLEGYVNSLFINEASIPVTAHHMTLRIEV